MFVNLFLKKVLVMPDGPAEDNRVGIGSASVKPSPATCTILLQSPTDTIRPVPIIFGAGIEPDMQPSDSSTGRIQPDRFV